MPADPILQKPDETSPPPTAATRSPNSSPKTSFIYPIRSLLSGRIQPAADALQSIPPTLASAGRSSSSDNISGKHSFRGKAADVLHGLCLVRKGSFDSAQSMAPLCSPTPGVSQPLSEDMQSQLVAASSFAETRQPRKSPPNFRHYPGEDGGGDSYPFSPRFYNAPPQDTASPSKGPFFTAGPTGEPIQYTPHQEENDVYGSRHPPQFSEAAADIFASSISTADLGPDTHQTRQPFNLSEKGIVHLGPVSSDGSNDSGSSRAATSGGRSESRSGMGSALGSNPVSSSRRGSASPFGGDGSAPARSVSDEAPRSDAYTSPGMGFPQRSSMGSSGASRSGVSSGGSSEPNVTFRFEHKEDENGHHIVVGREGKLTTCEDEPIRTPGAVQGYGVLVVVEENDETGYLVVRQVSENCSEILGVTPKYLFSLNCLTETLPDSQADVLWDNIQYLTEPDPDSESGQDDAPHVFLLSGLGQPRSSTPDDPGDAEGRRSWTCWCAAHRPSASSTSAGAASTAPANPNLIILEFELERDLLNPLYPPMEEPSSVISSPSTISTGSSSSPGSSRSTRSTQSSGRTLVSLQSSLGAGETAQPHSGAPGSSETIVVDPNAPGVETPDSARSGQTSSPNLHGLEGEEGWMPSHEQILESTTNRAKPLLALERLRRMSRAASAASSQPNNARGARMRRGGLRRGGGTGAVGMMDVFAVMAQINEQLGAAPDLDSFLQVVVGVIKDLTQFHRVLVYQFDENWNGQTVAELVEWNQTHDLYKGLNFPASDIPAQARQLYAINKVRLLYDRSQVTARMVARSVDDLDPPLNMTHCYLRAMSPIHIKYLGNMGVRASMSVSIMAFGVLWGLVACHSYGNRGMRVSFPVRQMLRLLSQSISRNIERLSYAQRLHTRKLINTMSSEQHPSGYIVSNADDLLGLFDADFGMLVIGEGAKILGPNQHSQEILIMAEYLRLKQFTTMQVSHIVTKDYPDLQLSMGLEVIAGLLYVPLSGGGRDFIAFLRKGQPRKVKWAGKPFKAGAEARALLEPRTSFKAWTEVVAGRCRSWTDEQLETAGVLALVYGKFIEVWRQKENALQTNKLTEILLSNASHEVRTPLNHIINYLEMALNGPLDFETRDNLVRSHAASKSLLFTINDLLDLTRLESGNETSFNEPFDLRVAIEDAVHLYRNEAARRNIRFNVEVDLSPNQATVIGDAKKIKTAVANLTANALKFTAEGSVTIKCRAFEEPDGLRDPNSIAVEIYVADTGCGIPSTKLESIFREFEQVETTAPKSSQEGLGLGLAVVARIVEQLGGQLRVDSKLGEGSRFSFLIPFSLYIEGTSGSSRSNSVSLRSLHGRSHPNSCGSPGGSEIESLVEALSSNHMGGARSKPPTPEASTAGDQNAPTSPPSDNAPLPSGSPHFPIVLRQQDATNSPPVGFPSNPEKLEPTEAEALVKRFRESQKSTEPSKLPRINTGGEKDPLSKLRVLIVEDEDINRMILVKRLTLDGHDVLSTRNGQECVETIQADPAFDCVLMDLQMPILNGWEATKRIRELERSSQSPTPGSSKFSSTMSKSSSKISKSSSSSESSISDRHNGRIPIFAVSASLVEAQRHEMMATGFDGWILKPVDFKRMRLIIKGVTDSKQRASDAYKPGKWEAGGWLADRSRKSP
ncbi:hypothetical protein JAAARDRAFT_30166 [Jaapia argillacea MUCL 33604]|uniref:Histidine kinase n=1 Tax=Jaapia argillacea MUCL 33604 TaxID=933084 RepID=A0A067Q5K4_9AGAM|nr:hypothetical protein JAAARDRAFT_30166 [Jaapia argillacea MUCL 33604]